MSLHEFSRNVSGSAAMIVVLLAASAARAQDVVRVEAGQPTVVVKPVVAVVAAAPIVIVEPPAQMDFVLPAAASILAMQPAEEAKAAEAPQPVATADPYGFTAWLNATRAQYGLSSVGYDPNLESWAQMNNSQQNARGIGHFVMGPARRQNSAMGQYASIGAMWMSSPAHRAALLDPTISFIGIAGSGAYWTFNAY